jgi:hypothetical protein
VEFREAVVKVLNSAERNIRQRIRVGMLKHRWVEDEELAEACRCVSAHLNAGVCDEKSLKYMRIGRVVESAIYDMAFEDDMLNHLEEEAEDYVVRRNKRDDKK